MGPDLSKLTRRRYRLILAILVSCGARAVAIGLTARWAYAAPEPIASTGNTALALAETIPIVPKAASGNKAADTSTDERKKKDWPQFRGPGGQGHVDSKNVPLSWSERDHVAWKAAIPGKGWSSPVIVGNQIWLTTALEQARSLRAICVDRDQGQMIHNVEVFAPEAPLWINRKNSHASPTPVVEAGRVYLSFGTYGFACLDAESGKILWANQELRLNHMEGPGSSPILFGDLLLLNCDGIDVQYVVALNKRTGTIVWRTDRSGEPNPTIWMRKSFCTPLVVESKGRCLAVSPGAHRVVAYDALTGREEWLVRYVGFNIVPRPVFGRDMVYICTGDFHPQLLAIRTDGKGDVTDTHVAWRVTRHVPTLPSPILDSDCLYIVNNGGVATCLDAASGKERWVMRIGGKHSASPILAGGRIYFFDESGKTTVIKAGPKHEVLATNQLDEGFMASAAVSGESLIVRTVSHLYRIEDRAK